MDKPAAFQFALIEGIVVYRPMSQAEYDAYSNGEPANENTVFQAFSIPKGYELSNVVIRTSGEIGVNVIRKD